MLLFHHHLLHNKVSYTFIPFIQYRFDVKRFKKVASDDNITMPTSSTEPSRPWGFFLCFRAATDATFSLNKRTISAPYLYEACFAFPFLISFSPSFPPSYFFFLFPIPSFQYYTEIYVSLTSMLKRTISSFLFELFAFQTLWGTIAPLLLSKRLWSYM